MPLNALPGLLPADPVLRLAVQATLALAVITMLVLLQVLVLSTRSQRRQDRRQAFDRVWLPVLSLWSLEEAPPAPPPLQPRQRLWLLLLFNRIQRSLRGPARSRLNRLLHRLDLVAYAEATLRSRSMRKRLTAIATLRHLADAAHWPAVLPLLGSSNTVVMVAAAQTLVAIDPDRAMVELLPRAARGGWPLPQVAALCRQAGPDAVTGPVLRALSGAPLEQASAIADLVAWADPVRCAGWARTTLGARGGDAEDEALLLAALRVLGALADPRDRSSLLGALDHARPAVRLAALQALRRQAAGADGSLVAALLADASWYVRQAAADTLVNLPGVGRDQADAHLAALDDPYGRDALVRAIVERWP